MHPIVRPIVSQAQLDAIKAAMREDGHSPIFPTHEVCSAGPEGSRIIGCFSLLATPVLNFWMHTKLSKPRDSLFAFQVAENLARCQGQNLLVVPCTKESPLKPYLEALGGQALWDTTLYLKSL